MPRVDPTVKRETEYIAAVTVIFSVLMQAVFLVIQKWDYTVLLGNILSALTTILNFFAMCITLQKAVQQDEKKAANMMKLSQSLRMLILLVIAAIGCILPCFNIWAVIIPLFFPRIAVSLRPLIDKNYKK